MLCAFECEPFLGLRVSTEFECSFLIGFGFALIVLKCVGFGRLCFQL